MNRQRRFIQVRPTGTGISRVPLVPLTNVDFLLGQAYDPKVTRLDRQPWGPTPGNDSQPRTGPIVTAEIPFTLVGGAQASVIAASDPNRKGLILQNKDPVDDLFYSFGALADETSTFIPPRSSILLDFVCPTDRISVFALVNISGVLKTMAPSG